jgi:hypothetical protein
MPIKEDDFNKALMDFRRSVKIKTHPAHDSKGGVVPDDYGKKLLAEAAELGVDAATIAKHKKKMGL